MFVFQRLIYVYSEAFKIYVKNKELIALSNHCYSVQLIFSYWLHFCLFLCYHFYNFLQKQVLEYTILNLNIPSASLHTYFNNEFELFWLKKLQMKCNWVTKFFSGLSHILHKYRVVAVIPTRMISERMLIKSNWVLLWRIQLSN